MKGLPEAPESRRTDDRFELIVESVPGALLMADRSRRITLVNRNAEDLFGYSRAELLGQPLEMLIPERYRHLHPEYVEAFFAEPKARPMGAGRELFGVRKDGVEVPIEIGLNPIETAAGPITLAVIIDITERKRADEARQQMAALVDSAEDAILIKSLDGIIRSWNPGAERLLGYRAQDIIGQPVARLIPDDRQNEALMIIDRISKGQPVAHFETVRCRSDGSLVDVSLTISPVRNRAGAIIGASKIMRNITQRKQREDELRRTNAELQQINQALDDFVYTASHDLRSPLTAVSTVAQWILEDDTALSTESRSRLTLIQGRIERMKTLLNDIRDYARAGRSGEPPGPLLSAAALVADAVATLYVPAGFSIHCDPAMEQLQVARMPLAQVFLNLIGNAIKHHDRQSGTVSVSVTASGAWLRFSVVDDGPGIPEQYREDVFQMFRTLKPRDEVEGSGMGLAMVRRLVERMGGRCGAEQRSGRGAHLWFDWPKSGHPERSAT